MLTLYIFPPGWGLPSLSPFCVKSILWLELAGLVHEVKEGDPRKSPTGKLPVLRHPGGMVADSGRIQRFLVHEHGDPFDSGLTPDEQALGHAVRRTCEEHLYWSSVWLKWAHPEGWSHMRGAISPMMPALARPLLPIIRRRPLKQLAHHGLGLHDDEELVARSVADLDALEVLVGEGPFLFGDEPTSFDMVVYAFVTAITAVPVDHPLTRHATSLTGLAHLVDAIDERRAASVPESP